MGFTAVYAEQGRHIYTCGDLRLRRVRAKSQEQCMNVTAQHGSFWDAISYHRVDCSEGPENTTKES